MRIFFDVDNTLLYSSGSEWTLRPGAQEVIAALSSQGHSVYIWSATGQGHCQRLVMRYGLDGYVTACYDKDPTCPVKPDLIVDDDWYLVQKYSGLLVSAFRAPDPGDRELFRVLEELTVLTRWT